MAVRLLTVVVITLLCVAGCGEGSIALGQASSSEITVGSYVVYERPVSPAVLDEAQFVQLQPNSVVQIGDVPPYTVSVQPLGGANSRTVGNVSCADRPSWTGIQGPDAVFFCVAQGGIGQFGLVDPVSGTLRVYPVNGTFPPPGTPLDIKGLVVSHSVMYWWVYLNGEPSQLYASGAVNLATGAQTAIPGSFGWGILSPNDALFQVENSGIGVSKWSVSDGGWIRVGTEPTVQGASFGGIDDAGESWAVAPTKTTDLYDATYPQEWYLTLAKPGSSVVRRWRFYGVVITAGPGFSVFEVPSGEIHIFFPLLRRTISIGGVMQPNDTRIATGTVAGWFRVTNPSAVTLLTVKNGHLEEIDIQSR